MRTRSQLFGRRAFSLLELVVVITIIGIIASFAIPAASTMIRGTDLNRAFQGVSNQINAARSQAVTKNRSIEVRFLKYADPEAPGESVDKDTTWKFHGIQLMEVLPNGYAVQLAPVERLPNSVMINDGKYSSLLDQTGAAESGQKVIKEQTPRDIDPALPRMKKGSERKYKYVAFRFMPDGSTNLSPKGNWYVTLYGETDGVKLAKASGSDDAIKTINYVTFQLDPVTGATRIYRPQAR